MHTILKQFGGWRLLAMILTVVPLLILPAVGMIWLWQTGVIRYWLAAFVICSGSGYLLHSLLLRRERQATLVASTQPDTHWPDQAADCWHLLEERVAKVTPQEWPLDNPPKLASLGREILDLVARYYHPRQEQPLLELTIPHALLIMERALRELRQEVVTHIPFSHKVTLGDLFLVNRWRKLLAPLGPWWRVLRAIITPQTAVFSEIRRVLGKQILDHGNEKVQTWLLQEYVRKVGYHAIELYSGHLTLSESELEQSDNKLTGSQVPRQHKTAAVASGNIIADPLQFVVLGRTNAGKSSLINALFEERIAPADILPDTTTGILPYYLKRDGQLEAVIFDTPGCDTALLTDKLLKPLIRQADLILWVTAANRADRQIEKELVQKIRSWQREAPLQAPPPLLAAVSQIDMLRPFGEWEPPYNLIAPRRLKAQQIAAAVQAIAADLDLLPAQTIPVCLKAERLYNVTDTLWAAILEQHHAADRVRFLRCLADQRRQENWQLIWRQLGASGRFLLDLPSRLKL